MDSSRNVGKIRNVSAQLSRSLAIAVKTSSCAVTSVRSWLSRSVSAPNTVPVSRTRTCSASLLLVEHSTSGRRPPRRSPGRLPKESLRSRPRPSTEAPRSCCQVRNARRVYGSSESRISSSSTDGSTLLVVEPAALGHGSGVLRAQRHLDEGLAEQRLLAQPRLRVGARSARSGGRSRSSPACGWTSGSRDLGADLADPHAGRRARRPRRRAASPPGTRPARGSPSA